jgi:hypothetical protein
LLGRDGASFGDQEAIGGDMERGVAVESAPPAPFIIAEAEFLLELLIIEPAILLAGLPDAPPQRSVSPTGPPKLSRVKETRACGTLP